MDVFKKGVTSFIYNILGATIGFAIQFLAAKILGASEFGKYSYFMGLANTIVLVLSFGIAFYFPKVFQNDIDKKALISGVFYTSIISLVIISPFIALVIDFSLLLDNYLLFLMSFSLISLGVYRSYLIAIGRADSSTKQTMFFVKLATIVLFFIFMKIFFTSQYSLIYVTIIANFIIVIPFLWKSLKKVKPNITFIKESYIFFLIQLFYMFFSEYSKVVQASFFDYKEVSYLSIALLIGQSITIFGQNFANVGMPIFARAFVDNDLNKIRIKFKEISRINAFFLIPIFLSFFFNAKLILSQLGDDYVEGTIMLQLILCGALINSISGPNGTVLLMGKKSYIELFNGVFNFVVVTSLILLFGRHYSWGVALAIAISQGLVNAIKTFEVYFFYKIVPFSNKDFFFILLLSFLGLNIFYFLSIFIEDEIFLLIINLIFVLLFWFLSFRLSPNKSDKTLFKSLVVFSKS